MPESVLLVKNMVCHRCTLAVEDILKRENLLYNHVITGEIHLTEELSDIQRAGLKLALSAIGLEVIDNRMNALIEKIKCYVIKKARNEVDEKDNNTKLSNFLSDKLNYEYTYLSGLFSDIEGRTIENLFIEHRIEKAKELLVYGQLSLTEIALELEYSSVAYLSTQFKKVTGLTPSHFKEIGKNKRKTLDHI